MQVYLNNTPILESDLNTAVALGRFDAMHAGHIEIISTAVKNAKDNGLKSLVYMFINDPLELTAGKRIKSVNSLEKRIEILESLDVDIVVADSFDIEFMSISCDNFIKEYIEKRFRAKRVIAGFNYRFGVGGSGNIDILKDLCAKRGIEVCAIPEVTVGGKPVSSTIIRQKISEGRVAEAAELLGRYFSIKGEVVKGNQVGKSLLGFPTANINMPSNCAELKFGVYISRTKLDGKVYPSITNVGGKPTVSDDLPCIETHIDAQLGDLYGQYIEVEFCDYIREISKFEGLDALAAKLKEDRNKARDFFKNKSII